MIDRLREHTSWVYSWLIVRDLCLCRVGLGRLCGALDVFYFGREP